MMIDVLSIDWSDRQRTVDYLDLTRVHDFDQDAGPVIFLPIRYSGATDGAFSDRIPVMRFDSFRDLTLHIYMQDRPQHLDFWYGMCGLLPEEDRPFAAGVFDQLVRLLDQTNEFYHPAPLPFEDIASREPQYPSAKVANPAAFQVKIQNTGSGFAAVQELYGWIANDMVMVSG